jgi:hypothetical protein
MVLLLIGSFPLTTPAILHKPFRPFYAHVSTKEEKSVPFIDLTIYLQTHTIVPVTMILHKREIGPNVTPKSS